MLGAFLEEEEGKQMVKKIKLVSATYKIAAHIFQGVPNVIAYLYIVTFQPEFQFFGCILGKDPTRLVSCQNRFRNE